MKLARIIGTVVATTKSPGLEGVKLLLAEPLDHDQSVDGPAFVLADSTRAGEGDLVWWVGGSEAALALPENFVPVDAAVVGIVDAVYRDGGQA